MCFVISLLYVIPLSYPSSCFCPLLSPSPSFISTNFHHLIYSSQIYGRRAWPLECHGLSPRTPTDPSLVAACAHGSCMCGISRSRSSPSSERSARCTRDVRGAVLPHTLYATNRLNSMILNLSPLLCYFPLYLLFQQTCTYTHFIASWSIRRICMAINYEPVGGDYFRRIYQYSLLSCLRGIRCMPRGWIPCLSYAFLLAPSLYVIYMQSFLFNLFYLIYFVILTFFFLFFCFFLQRFNLYHLGAYMT